MLPVDTLVDRIKNLVKLVSRAAGARREGINQEQLATTNAQLLVENQLLQDINRGLLRDATNQKEVADLESQIVALKTSARELEISIEKAREQSLASIQE